MNKTGTDEDGQNALFRLDGLVAFISGAGGWLGQPMARALALAGAHVILNGRNRIVLDSYADELKGLGLKVSTAIFDVTDEKAVQNHIVQMSADFGRLDVLVNNASSGRPGTIISATSADFDQLYRVNVTAAFQLLQHSMPLLKKSAGSRKGGSSVINVASMYGSVSPDPSIYGNSGMNNPPYYGSAKAALIQLTRYAACHLASDGIRVNCLSPGPFPSREALARDPKFAERLREKNPMHRTGEPQEMAGPLLFLASEASSFVTGTNVAVDGGWTAW